MAVTNQNIGTSYAADADMSSKQFYIVKQTGAESCAVAGAGEKAVGISENNPLATEAVAIVTLGMTKVVTDGTTPIAIGDSLMADANGKAVKASTTADEAIGIAAGVSTADGVVIAINVLPHVVA